MKRGLLLINLGTPSGKDVASVRRYLREFLTDKRVIDLPSFLRYMLVYGFILPFRPQKSAHAYQSIWTEQGSPLLYHSQNLITQLRLAIGTKCTIALGMRYGKPSIETALESLKDCETIIVLPLYPQYSSAATGSSIEKVIRSIASWERVPSLTIISDFYKHQAYIQAQAQLIKNYSNDHEYLLFSYHGVPERQIYKSGCNPVCSQICPPITDTNQGCYKAQCHYTSTLIAKELNLSTDQFSTSFQSRLGKTPWIKPYTEATLIDLANKGIKKLAIVCPSFVADCLETLEEIAVRAKNLWLEHGGKQFTLIPCMNADPLWVKAIIDITNL